LEPTATIVAEIAVTDQDLAAATMDGITWRWSLCIPYCRMRVAPAAGAVSSSAPRR
jgi:hypothetical protein